MLTPPAAAVPLSSRTRGGVANRGTSIPVHDIRFTNGASMLRDMSESRTNTTPVDSTIPFSRAAARFRIGPTWLSRVGWEDSSRTPEGLLDSIEDLKSPYFDPDSVHPCVRGFYESTVRYDLKMRSFASWWMRVPLFIYAVICRIIGQTEFPTDDVELSNRMVALKPGVDTPGRNGERAWIRTHGRNNARVLYVILVAWHATGRSTYMHTAVPLPGGNIASLMRMSTIEGGGVRHETRETPHRDGPGAVYFSTRFGAARLPLSERIDVWPASHDGVPADLRAFSRESDVVALHTFTLFGRPFLRLEYVFSPPFDKSR